MINKIIKISVCLIIIVTGLPAATFSQGQNDDSLHYFRGSQGDVEGMKGSLKMRQQRFEKFRQGKMFELLELTDDQKEKFIPEMKQMRQKGRVILEEKKNLIDELSEILKTDENNERKIIEYIERMENLNKQHLQLRYEFMEKVRNILNPVQLGKLVVFEDRFERRAVEKFFSGRQKGELGKKRRKPGGGGGKPPQIMLREF